MKKIFDQALKLVTPPEEMQKQKDQLVEQVIRLVKSQLQSYPQITDLEIVGSYAKGTWLPQKADVDIFIKFHPDVPKPEFVKLSRKIGFAALKKFNPYVRYAEHPFVEAQIKDTKVNLVPCYDVEAGDWKSSADRSPFHTKFMIKSLTAEMKNQVRLLKQFLKANGIYGAEIAKQGFSGYVAEVLILNFGSFERVLKAASQLKHGQVIGSAARSFDTIFVIVDPVDANRNLAAAISTENVARFVLAARSFLNKPSVSFFYPKKKLIKSKNLLKNVVAVSFMVKPRSPDIIWGQLKRAATSMATQIEQEGFTVLRNSAILEENNATLLFLLESVKLNRYKLRQGPVFLHAEHVEKFVKSNFKKSQVMWVNKDGRICSLQKRPHTDGVAFVRNLLRQNHQTAGVPHGLKNDIRKFRVFTADKAASEPLKNAAMELISTERAILPN